MPPPSHADLDREGVEIIEERSPTLLLDGMVLVTGQVDRITDFEKGFHHNRHIQIMDGNPIRGSGMTRRWYVM